MSDILYSKLRLQVPQALDGVNATIISQAGNVRTVEMNSPITDVMLAGMEKYRVRAGITEEDVSFGYGEIKKLQAVPVPDSLENASWDYISDSIKSGTFSNLASVGDTKSFVMNGKTYHAEVVAINDGTGSAASWYPNKTVDFICKELYETKYSYNATDTNVGGFPSSEIKTTLNNTIYPLLPSDLKDVITAKSHSYQAGRWSGGSWSSSMVTSADNLWLPTYYEIAGTTASYAAGETSSNNKPYTLVSTVKNIVGGSASSWWLGSPSSGSSGNFWYAHRSDGFGSNGNASLTLGLPLCFRIG